MTGWRNWALQTYKGYLQDKSHQVPTFTPQGSVAYRPDVPATSGVNEFSNGTYSLIEPLLPAGHPLRRHVLYRLRRPSRVRINTLRKLRMALYSLRCINEIEAHTAQVELPRVPGVLVEL